MTEAGAKSPECFSPALKNSEGLGGVSDLKVKGNFLLEAQCFSKYHFSAGWGPPLGPARESRTTVATLSIFVRDPPNSLLGGTMKQPYHSKKGGTKWFGNSLYSQHLFRAGKDETGTGPLGLGFMMAGTQGGKIFKAMKFLRLQWKCWGMTSGHRVKRSILCQQEGKDQMGGNGPTRSIWTSQKFSQRLEKKVVWGSGKMPLDFCWAWNAASFFPNAFPTWTARRSGLG
ncbi:hypothetical protein TNIN_283451 [Trichonephila inaurata madagascariensis]|uniref:Uncharacterized protein n=1 Tax=Trichonephila inaurata madagascariensis TaxID=2747483 RepID=A0A8X7CD63_9ARAC|nr:hypothetical protein TNIN_283451 [Trichonephila inaurata madagascariensis]